MALIIWRRKVRLQLKEQLEYARQEFGLLTARRRVEQLQMFEKRIEEYPASYTPVQELKDKPILYRGCTVMRNFKIIYYYEEPTDTVVVVTLRDMRRNPIRLVKEFRP